MWNALAKSDGLPSSALLFLFIYAVVKALQNSWERKGRLDTHFEGLASRLGGTFCAAELFQNGHVRFEIEGRPAVLEYRGGRSGFTLLRVTLQDARLGGLRIARDGFGEGFRSLMDGPRVSSGDSIFDREFAVHSHSGALGQPETLTARLFSPERRQPVMTSVRRLNHCHGLWIEIGPRLLEVRIGEPADTAEVAMAMVRTARDFLGFLADLDVVRPEVVAVEYSEQMSGHCPICLATLAEPLVRCPRCRAPHHRQCWEYLGRCATYGCQPGHRRVA